MGDGAVGVCGVIAEEAVERVRERTGGFGARSVLECVGRGPSMSTAMSIARPGGAVGRVGVPPGGDDPRRAADVLRHVTIACGPAPVRASMHALPPDVLEGRIRPGRVFDRVTSLDGVPDGYRAMNGREAVKVMIEL